MNRLSSLSSSLLVLPAPVLPAHAGRSMFSAGNVLALPASKRDTGLLLDGVQHDGYPPVDTAGAA